jgi:quercetin dioxygenase-like cupin family protein
MLEGTAVRLQGGAETLVKAGDFWQTPGGVAHGIRAGSEGALILDVFSPPREEYKKAGKGFAAD